jgi:hypothetical protein
MVGLKRLGNGVYWGWIFLGFRRLGWEVVGGVWGIWVGFGGIWLEGKGLGRLGILTFKAEYRRFRTVVIL